MTGGRRVRVGSGGWPERRGCLGTIVERPEGCDTYPWAGCSPYEVVVRLDDDPIGLLHVTAGVEWSCVYDLADLVLLDEADR